MTYTFIWCLSFAAFTELSLTDLYFFFFPPHDCSRNDVAIGNCLILKNPLEVQEWQKKKKPAFDFYHATIYVTRHAYLE